MAKAIPQVESGWDEGFRVTAGFRDIVSLNAQSDHFNCVLCTH